MLAVPCIILIYLFLIKPNNNSRREKMKSFEKVYITHRGFFNNEAIPENSLSAFKRTVRNGLGTELDVQLTKDDRLVVFHDPSLKRMCGIDKKLTDCTYDELQNYPLLNTSERIPLFEDVLNALKPDTPLIIEIKPEGDFKRTTEKTVQLMKTLNHTYVMESFHPLVVKYLKDNHPEIIRGQLAYDMFKDKNNRQPFIMKLVATNLLLNFLTKPDFIAYHVHSRYNPSFMICSRLFRTECVAWTVKNEDDLNYARKFCQQIIFDSFIPSDIDIKD